MGKVSYFKKTLLILLFLLLPLAYTTSLIYDNFEDKSSKIQSSLTELEKNYALYKMMFVVQDFQNSATAYLHDTKSLALSVQMNKDKERLLDAQKKLNLCLNEETFSACKIFFEKINFSLLDENSKKLIKYMQEYKFYLYEHSVDMNFDYLASSDFPMNKVTYLLRVELPTNTLLLTNMSEIEDRTELLLKIGAIKGSVDKTDLLLHSLEAYANRFEDLNNKYKVNIDNYINYLLDGDLRRSKEMQEAVLSHQLSLFNALQSFLDTYLQEQSNKEQLASKIFIVLVLLSACIGLYLFIAAYLSLSLSLKKIFQITVDVSKGKLNSRISPDSEDEMGLLSMQFNTMIESLDYHYALLNEYKRAVDASAIVVKTDINGVITYVNESYENISAYTKEELIGSTERLMQSKNTSHEKILEMWECINNKKTYKAVFENIAKTGKSFFVESTTVPILNRSGEISEFISIMFDITPLYRQKEKLQSQVYIDELTSIPNRLKLIEDIGVTESSKLVVINIDGFKEINTIYGENIGDLALQKMAKEIKNALNTRHLQLYKLSADEFAILAGEEISIANFREDVALLSHYLSHIKLECGEHEISVRLSLGAAISELHDSLRPLISMADMALKEAKRKMRPYVFYNDIISVDEDLEKNYKMIQLIEQAIKEDKVYCCYQGIINASTGKIEKYETLMRLEDNKGKNLSPQSFVDIAKRARYYPKLTQKVVQEALFTFLHRDESVSINLSVDDIMDDSTYIFILDALRNCGCAERVIFEFLESVEIEFNDRILDFTAEVKKMGAQIAIDDFGSGYSNYAYLMKLGVDILKIDASLIKEIDKNENSRLITKSIIDIAHALGMKTVAEHVHTKEIQDIVMSMGIDYLQGYYLHKPVNTLETIS